MSPVHTSENRVETIRDHFWLWAHDAGCHNRGWNIPKPSRMTPAEAAFYLNIPNLIMVRYEGLPEPPFEQYALPLKPLKRVVWSIVGAGGATGNDEREYVLQLANRQPNIVGAMMDDFFKPADDAGSVGVLTLDELGAVRSQLAARSQPLDLWVVLYDHQLHLPVREHLALCDVVTFWTWTADQLPNLERNFAAVEELAGDRRKVLGCYMWDYGQGRPMPLDVFQAQCRLGLQWLYERRIEGIIFLASCICDLGLPTVEWARTWIARIGDKRLP